MRKKETFQVLVRTFSKAQKQKNSMVFPRNYKESRDFAVPLLCRTKSDWEWWQGIELERWAAVTS